MKRLLLGLCILCVFLAGCAQKEGPCPIEITSSQIKLRLNDSGRVEAEEDYVLRFCRTQGAVDFVLPRPKDERQFFLNMSLADTGTGTLLMTEVGPALSGQAYIYETTREGLTVRLRVKGLFAAGNAYAFRLRYLLGEAMPLEDSQLAILYPKMSLESTDWPERTTLILTVDEEGSVPPCELILLSEGRMLERRTEGADKRLWRYTSYAEQSPAFYLLLPDTVLSTALKQEEALDLKDILEEARQKARSVRFFRGLDRIWIVGHVLLALTVFGILATLWLQRILEDLRSKPLSPEALCTLHPQSLAKRSGQKKLWCFLVPDLLDLLAHGVLEPSGKTKKAKKLSARLEALCALMAGDGSLEAYRDLCKPRKMAQMGRQRLAFLLLLALASLLLLSRTSGLFWTYVPALILLAFFPMTSKEARAKRRMSAAVRRLKQSLAGKDGADFVEALPLQMQLRLFSTAYALGLQRGYVALLVRPRFAFLRARILALYAPQTLPSEESFRAFVDRVEGLAMHIEAKALEAALQRRQGVR